MKPPNTLTAASATANTPMVLPKVVSVIAAASTELAGGVTEATEALDLLRTVLRAKFSDAQCGFKAIRTDAAHALLIHDGHRLALNDMAERRYAGAVLAARLDPDLRGVLPLDGLKVSRSLRRSAHRYEIRFDQADLDARLPWLKLLPVFLVFASGVYAFFGLYQSRWRFASLPDLSNIVKAASTLALGLLGRRDEAVAAVDRGGAAAAFLLRPTRIEDVWEVAQRGDHLRQGGPLRIAVGIDARGGNVAVEGWAEGSEMTDRKSVV